MARYRPLSRPTVTLLLSLSLILTLQAAPSWAQDTENKSTTTADADEKQQQCMAAMLHSADDDMTIAELRKGCEHMVNPTQTSQSSSSAASSSAPTAEVSAATAASAPSTAPDNAPKNADDTDDTQQPAAKALEKRMTMEALNSENRFLLTPHNRNYLLPAVYTATPNRAPFEQALAKEADLQHTEIEFQLSMKVLIAQDLLHNNGNLYVAYTNHSFWQAYNAGISRPFRETNHEPELIFSAATDWEIFGFRNVLNQIIVSHQSNGQSGSLSRSWNRIKARSIFERGHFAFSITPWYRLPEDEEDDDNPDIDDYYGHYELSGAYTRNDHIISFMTRRPFASKGALELNWSFPISSTVRGYIKAFDGYGASMIDYNAHTRSIGLGVTFTDLF